MAIRDRSPQEQAAMYFKAAGLGDRSAREAARLLFESGITFETAAVMGQRIGEACTATASTIREEADRYRRAAKPARTTTAFGRPLQEADSPEPAATTGRTAFGRSVKEALDPSVEVGPAPQPSPAPEQKQLVDPTRTTRIDGVEHYVVHEYEPVQKQAGARVTESGSRRSPWGREIPE